VVIAALPQQLSLSELLENAATYLNLACSFLANFFESNLHLYVLDLIFYYLKLFSLDILILPDLMVVDVRA
jgi:hypothetical protein